MYLVYLFALICYCHIFHLQCLSNCTFNVLYNYITSTCQISKHFHVDHIILNKVKKKTFQIVFQNYVLPTEIYGCINNILTMA